MKGVSFVEILLVRDFEVSKVDEMQTVYASVGWINHTSEIITRIFNASSHVAIAYHESRIIGFSRALSDGFAAASIYDVVVRSDYQGKGVGRRLVEDLLYQLRDVSCVHLISTIGNEDFYRRLGLKKVKTAMARYLNPSLDADYLE